MAVPKYDELMKPLLVAVKDGSETPRFLAAKILQLFM
jgi:hypothetical protein